MKKKKETEKGVEVPEAAEVVETPEVSEEAAPEAEATEAKDGEQAPEAAEETAQPVSLVEQISQATAMVEELTHTCEAKDSEIADLKDQVASLTADAEAKGDELKDAKAESNKLSERLGTARKALVHPALADAGVRGEETPLEDGGEATVEQSLTEQLAAIEDAKKRNAFYKEHKDALLKEAQEAK
jgi:ABC-type transporter Mla subunit MlaD